MPSLKMEGTILTISFIFSTSSTSFFLESLTYYYDNQVVMLSIDFLSTCEGVL